MLPNEITDLLITAEDKITPSLRKHDGHVTSNEQGDVTLAIEDKYHHRLGQFLNANSIGATIISEGKVISDYKNCAERYILFLDPFEGSTNFFSGKLPYGVNIAVFPDRDGDIQVKDWISALIADRHNGIKYSASKSADGGLVSVIERGRLRKPNRDITGPLIEVPLGYTKHDKELFNQIAYYNSIKDALGDNQFRSIDSTGIRLVDVVDGSTRVYVEGRNLKKLGGAWNIIPSAIIINAGGGIATRLDGTPFDEEIVWNRESYKVNGGYNPDAGRDVLACHKISDYDLCLNAISSVRGREAEYLIAKIQQANNKNCRSP
ncbi:hypothetical protein K9M79_06650 [Candidatus Woesearchaeota archaeon]|nr:hypothetical protein [Candidatus Woesearchaeota archaeon]